MIGLCWRCEHRARFHEHGHGPRYECSQVKFASSSCYQYWPTQPLVVKPEKGDNRPIAGGMLGCRLRPVRVAYVIENIKKVTDGFVMYWMRPR